MTSLTQPLILVDGSSYLFRAYHALPPLMTRSGMATGAMHGVLNMLDKLRKDYQPEYMVVVFDAAGKTFRDLIYPEYKANRPPMPEDLREQIQPLFEIIRAQGYPLLQINDVEADDVIGTLATRFAGDVLISTGDKDMAQLVNERVHLINTMSESYLDTAGVKNKFGVLPEQIRDYLSLVGDNVDNIPGVDKVGPKTAVKWLSEYGSLQGVINNADKIGGKVGENLRAALAHLPLTYQLVTIKCDVELDCSFDALRMQAENTLLLQELYARYEFRTRLAALTKAQPKTAKKTSTLPPQEATTQSTPTPFPLILEPSTLSTTSELPTPQPINKGEAQYSTIFTQTELEALVVQLKKAPLFAFDTETTSLNALEAELVGISISTQAGIAAYIPLAHDYIGAPEQLNREQVLQVLKPILEGPQYSKVGQNLKYDFTVMQNYGITLQGLTHDTMLESYVLDATANRHDMDTLAEKVLNHKTIRFEEIAGKGKKQLTFNQIDLTQAAPYAAEDADITLRLHQQFWPKIAAEPALTQVYQTIEIPVIPVLSRMERHGVKIDTLLLSTQSQELTKRIDEITLEAFKVAGQEFNLSSPKQLQEILFEKLQIPLEGVRKTPTGQPSTAEDVLEVLAENYELPQLILEHRTLSKLKSTYTDKLPAQVNSRTGRVHTSYHQTGTVTGRLSSSDPNLQNIPIRSAEGRKIRQAFIADSGFKLVAADYSQIELRIMAHLSNDASLLKAFSAGADIHKATAAEVFHTPLDQVTQDQRRAAKAINFGLIYGMSAFGLAKQLGIERREAQQYIELYFARYPGVKQYMESTRERAKTLGYVETLFGRRLPVPDINSRNAAQRQYAERTAINAPMQGTAADIMKKAMVAVDNYLQTHESSIRMILQVHDELVFEVPDALVKDFKLILAPLMTQVVTLKVPLLVEIGEGTHWDDAH
ncbi:MAG: polymerase [Pseudomonadota bacterium]